MTTYTYTDKTLDFRNIFAQVRDASRQLVTLDDTMVIKILLKVADSAERNTALILGENEKDLTRMAKDDPKYDRLKLTEDRIKAIAAEMRQVAKLPSPLKISLEKKTLDNGLQLEKITVPLGVIGIIYEARPNVTFDVFSLCMRSGNACILKGGSDAEYSNILIVRMIQSVLKEFGINPNIITLLPSGRDSTLELLQAVGDVDVIIPRGSQQLIDFVRNNSKVPVIETGAGIVHAYFDQSGDTQQGADIIFNSKTRRVSVCNALDCLIVHQSRLSDLPQLTRALADKNVKIYADKPAYDALKVNYPNQLLEHALNEHFGIEFLDYKMSIRTVPGIEEALDHIYNHSSKHSEVIIAEDQNAIEHFLSSVDAAAVYANASTAFTDGGQFGMGAEIGISTQKLHARGPMGLREMTSYKWIIRGNGNIRTP
ncbi:MAG: glutamate-5-semialdehyde dehydrogenase [Chryseolinea sp.]